MKLLFHLGLIKSSFILSSQILPFETKQLKSSLVCRKPFCKNDSNISNNLSPKVQIPESLGHPAFSHWLPRTGLNPNRLKLLFPEKVYWENSVSLLWKEAFVELSGGIGQDQLKHQEFVSQWRGQKLLSCSHISSDNGINK